MNKSVIIYSTPSCVYCKLAKEYLTKQGVAFEEKDVAADMAARQDMLKVSGQMGVPVIVVDNKDVIVGFDQQHLAKLLGLAG